MNLSVIGLGIVSKVGEREHLENLLTKDLINTALLPSEKILPIDFSNYQNISPQLIRRMSHFAKLSLLSAGRALKDSGVDVTGKSIGIIQGSVYGPIISGIQAFDELIDFGDNQLSPTNFSGSVFNTSATYLSLAFGIQGSTLAHTSGMDTLANSLFTASNWLESGAADYIIMGIGDEYTSFFDHNAVTNGKSILLPTCEGWTTFIVSKGEKAKYGKIEFSHLKALPEIENQKNIYSVWHEQIKADEFQRQLKNNRACLPVHLRGSYPAAAAFDLAFALICAKNKRFPVDNGQPGIYQVQDLSKDERISFYCLSENNEFFECNTIIG